MVKVSTSSASSITLRIYWPGQESSLAKVTAAIEHVGGSIVGIDISQTSKGKLVRDITVFTSGSEHAEQVKQAVEALPHVDLIHVSDRTFLMHLGGKLETNSKVALKTRDDLSMAYTPGVARVCLAIKDHPQDAFNLTIKKNTVAVVSDGTAVLGLGDIGPEAAMPVMEGKAVLFKEFAGVDAFPICLATKDVDEIVQTVINIAPAFGGINLEDISAPRCFEVEERLKKSLNIPVFHDDQHGTAVVLVAAFINALKIVNKKAEDLKVALCGVGAAGVACTDMLLNLGVKNIIGCDRNGAIYQGRSDLNAAKTVFAGKTNPNKEQGSIHDVIKGADVFIGLSGPNVLVEADIKNMAEDAIVFAMSNPVPEIMPEVASPYVKVIATGRSDYPNQINNVLCFPGLFRGALNCLATTINDEMKIAAAHAIADIIPDKTLHQDYIVPSVFDKKVAIVVAQAVKEAAIRTGVARKK